jgi:transposase
MYHREHTPGYREGRPKKFRREQMNLALSLVEQGKSYRVVEEMTGISKTTIYREKKQRLSGQTYETEKSP